jgi:hypothetical protein
MNFLKLSKDKIYDNAVMESIQPEVAIKFVDGLYDLGIVQEPMDRQTVVATVPLFIVPKAGVRKASGMSS